MRALVLAEFRGPAPMVAAVEGLRRQGYAALDTYTPYPVHGASEALGLPKSKVPLIALIGGLTGALTAYLGQFWTAAVNYPLDSGGRPAHAPPAFIPITFELGVLLSALSIFFGLLFLMRLPQPYHPAFEIPAFASASKDGFWVSVETADVERDEPRLREALRAAGARQVEVVVEP